MKENGLLAGGIMVILFALSLIAYSSVSLKDMFKDVPEFTFSMEPAHLKNHDFNKTYTALKDKSHWNFGVGLKGTHRYRNFDILDNDYIQIIGL